MTGRKLTIRSAQGAIRKGSSVERIALGQDLILHGEYMEIFLRQILLDVPFRSGGNIDRYTMVEVQYRNLWDWPLRTGDAKLIDSEGDQYSEEIGYISSDPVGDEHRRATELYPFPESTIEGHTRTKGWIAYPELPAGVVPERLVFKINVFSPGATSGLVRESEVFEFTLDAVSQTSPGQSSAAAPVTGALARHFRRATWGMSQSDVTKLEDSKLLDSNPDRLVYGGTLLGFPCGISYDFRDGRLRMGRYVFDHDNDLVDLGTYYKLKEQLESKYGEPAIEGPELNEGWEFLQAPENPIELVAHLAVGAVKLRAFWRTEDSSIALLCNNDDEENVQVWLLYEEAETDDADEAEFEDDDLDLL